MTAPVLSVTVPVTSAEFVAWPRTKPAFNTMTAVDIPIRILIVASKSIY
jgi:hypothetical protein